ncbi:MAG: NAD(P)H-binding protein [Verrucomicrobiota bacterium]
MVQDEPDDFRRLIAIAGASGFVGSFVRSELESRFRFRGLTRSPTVADRRVDEQGNEWRHCDLFSLPKVTEALAGCDYGIYLVHSMAPSSRMVQGSFADMDLLLADNFIRAAEDAGVKRVVYLGGLLPDDTSNLSPHLRSRLEVERVLRSRSVPVVALRAGLIFGPGGSSFTMLIKLVRRLPVMILPRWVRSRTHSIDIHDVVRAIDLALTDDRFGEGIFDLGGHKPMTYRELILKTGEQLGNKSHCLDVPVNAFGLSRHWVSLFGGVSTSLVGPLLESLTHDLEATPNPLLDEIASSAVPFEESLRQSVDRKGNPLPNPRREVFKEDGPKIKREKHVRSVQRMPLPEGWLAGQVEEEYGKWLTKRFWGLLKVSIGSEGELSFDLVFPKVRLLLLKPTPYSLRNQRRRAFYISGGFLTLSPDPPGRFEFRLFPENGFLTAAIHDFQPRLPWWLYSQTQARIHLFVMKMFGRHLRKLKIAQEKA